jgi:hypothetical protein
LYKAISTLDGLAKSTSPHELGLAFHGSRIAAISMRRIRQNPLPRGFLLRRLCYEVAQQPCSILVYGGLYLIAKNGGHAVMMSELNECLTTFVVTLAAINTNDKDKIYDFNLCASQEEN